MKRRERNIIIETANELSLECWGCSKLYYQALANGDKYKIQHYKKRYNDTVSAWHQYKNRFNDIKFYFFSMSFYRLLWKMIKLRDKQIDNYIELIKMGTNNVY